LIPAKSKSLSQPTTFDSSENGPKNAKKRLADGDFTEAYTFDSESETVQN